VIQRYRQQYSVRRMCRVLGVSPSGYYAWSSRPESQRAREDRRLRLRVREIFEQSGRTYGSPRIAKEFRDQGESCGKRRVARLMREEGLVARRRPTFTCTTDSSHSWPVAPNRLDQRFTVEAPDTVWAGDITYVATAQGWLYLAVLLDLCSRRIVGWATSDRCDSELTLEVLRRAIDQRQPGPGLLHHSDRGSQYACHEYRERLSELGIAVSMSRTGNCFDNAPVESFFSSLKIECVRGRRFTTRAEAHSALFDYLELFYNRRRLHSALGYKSPARFEEDAA
jgi:transposase InsO family protein